MKGKDQNISIFSEGEGEDLKSRRELKCLWRADEKIK